MKTIFLLLLLTHLSFMTGSVASASEETTFKVKTEGDKKRVSLLKKQFKLNDSALTKEPSRLLLFAQVADPKLTEQEGYLVPTDKIVRVPDSKSWPDLTVTSYIILLNDAGAVAAIEEVPVSESGDWSSSYTHYFDDKGNTVGFKRYSGFFMGCPSKISKETSLYFFDKNQQVIQKEYTLINQDDKPINPADCDFMYRHEYIKYKNWKELAGAKGIPEI